MLYTSLRGSLLVPPFPVTLSLTMHVNVRASLRSCPGHGNCGPGLWDDEASQVKHLVLTQYGSIRSYKFCTMDGINYVLAEPLTLVTCNSNSLAPNASRAIAFWDKATSNLKCSSRAVSLSSAFLRCSWARPSAFSKSSSTSLSFE